MKRIQRIHRNENQLALPFGQIRELAISYDTRAKIFFALVTVLAVAFATYIYAINAAARNIASSQAIETEVNNMSRDLDSLEFAYIEMRNNVTIDTAYEKGYKEERSPLFVSRNKSASLTFNTINR